VVVRLVLGILAVVFLPLGIVFTIIGLTVEEVDRGEPEAFVYVGLPLLAVGACLAIAFAVLWRRERARRRRRREGLHASAEIVRALPKANIRSGSRIAWQLTVRLPATSAPVTTTFFASPASDLKPGGRIDVLYDPADPSNFEPAL
jgi:hypothetical protein